MRHQKNQTGFSLVELLIVVVVIGIICAIAIPSFLKSKRAANEASAQASLRAIHSCEATYYATVGFGTYTDLSTLAVHTLTDNVLGSGSKSGYLFEIHPTATGVTPAQFFSTAVPRTASGAAQSGSRRFGVTEDGVMHGDGTALSPYANHAEVRSAPVIN